MPETWPSGVPHYVRGGSWKLVRPFRDPLRTEMEDGNQRATRSTTKNIATISFSLIPLTKAQFDTFMDWVRDDLVDGTLPDGFTMTVWTGSGYSSRTCRFPNNPPYEAVTEGHYVVVTMTLDVENL